MAEREEISYDMVDPLTNEKPFFVSESSKLYQALDSKKSRFPKIPILIYLVAIPLSIFLTTIFYIGGTWDPVSKITDLNYLIVNEDSGCISPVCAGVGLNETTKIGASYIELNGKAGKFDYIQGDLQRAVDEIEDHNYWIAIYIPPTFTVDLLSNLEAVSKTKATPVTVTLVFDEARSYTTVTYAKKVFSKIEKNFYNSLVNKFSSTYGSFNKLFLLQGIQYQDKNLHVVNGFGQNFSTFISLLLLWIGTIATSVISHFFYPFEKHWIEKANAKNAIAKTMILKAVVVGIIMFFISLIVTVIPLVVGDVSNAKGFGALLFFLFFFSLSGIGINNLLIHLIPFIQYYLVVVLIMILQLISCGGLIDNEIQYGFFNIGKILPMYYGVREMKYIYWLSGPQYQVANIMILLAWSVVTIACALFMYYLELKVKRRRWLKENQIVEAKN